MDSPTPTRPFSNRLDERRELTTQRLLDRLHDPAAPLDVDERQALIDEVIVVNMPLARRIAGRFDQRGCPLEDLEQAACLALVKAVQRYDPSTGHHFLSYAVPCITGEVKHYFRDRGWMVRPPRPVQELQPLVEREMMRFDLLTGQRPGDAEVARRLGVPVASVRQALAARGCFTPASLNKAVTHSTDVFVGDALAAPEAEGEFLAAEARAVLVPALAALDADDRLLVQLRFVDQLTQSEIGVIIGASQSHVSRLVQDVLDRMRQTLEPVPVEQPRSA